MSKPGALLIGGLTHAKKEWEDCASFADLKVCTRRTATNSADKFEQSYSGTSRAEFLGELDKGTYNNVVALYRSNESTSVGKMGPSRSIYAYYKQITGPFDAELVAKLPPSLKYICHNGAGYDNIDVEACSSRGEVIFL